jgi:hypothetical protein
MVEMRSKTSRLIELPRINDSRGSLSVIEAGTDSPFPIKRVFYIYDIPADARRAGHALRTCEQLIIAASGEFEAISDDGAQKTSTRLRSGGHGLYVPALTWLELVNFTDDAVCLVLASEIYDEFSYIRDYEEFIASAT